MRLLAVQKLLIVMIIVLMVVSTTGVLLNKQTLFIASFFTLMNMLGSDFIISSALADAPNKIMLFVQVCDVIGNLMLTILLTTLFYQILSRLDLRYAISGFTVRRLKKHVIIVPGNDMGVLLARRLKDNGVPYVIVDKDFFHVSDMLSKGLLACYGNATDPQALIGAGIASANALVALDKEDATNMYIAMTAGKLNRKLKISSRLRRIEDISKLSKVGVTKVILPEIAVGKELGNFLVGSVPVKTKA